MTIEVRFEDFYVSDRLFYIIIDRDDDVRGFFSIRFEEVTLNWYTSFIIELTSSFSINDRAEAAGLQRSYFYRVEMGDESVLSFFFSYFKVLMRESGSRCRIFVLRIEYDCRFFRTFPILDDMADIG